MKKVNCGYCGGGGVAPSGGWCPVCKGRGEVEVEEPYRTCAFCGGTGKQRHYSHLTCLACGGKGVITVKEPTIECPACHGQGRPPWKEHLVCIRCHGAGFITAKA